MKTSKKYFLLKKYFGNTDLVFALVCTPVDVAQPPPCRSPAQPSSGAAGFPLCPAGWRAQFLLGPTGWPVWLPLGTAGWLAGPTPPWGEGSAD